MLPEVIRYLPNGARCFVLIARNEWQVVREARFHVSKKNPIPCVQIEDSLVGGSSLLLENFFYVKSLAEFGQIASVRTRNVQIL